VIGILTLGTNSLFRRNVAQNVARDMHVAHDVACAAHLEQGARDAAGGDGAVQETDSFALDHDAGGPHGIDVDPVAAHAEHGAAANRGGVVGPDGRRTHHAHRHPDRASVRGRRRSAAARCRCGAPSASRSWPSTCWAMACATRAPATSGGSATAPSIPNEGGAQSLPWTKSSTSVRARPIRCSGRAAGKMSTSPPASAFTSTSSSTSIAGFAVASL
jgi:hypothetical protein